MKQKRSNENCECRLEGANFIFCPLYSAASNLLSCVAAFVGEFGFDVECDEEIDGCDAVDWISQNMHEFKNAMKKAKGVKS
jgi:hypothetical protein